MRNQDAEPIDGESDSDEEQGDEFQMGPNMNAQDEQDDSDIEEDIVDVTEHVQYIEEPRQRRQQPRPQQQPRRPAEEQK